MFADLHGEDGLRKVPGPEVELPDPLLDGQRPQDQPRPSHPAAARGRTREVGVQGALVALWMFEACFTNTLLVHNFS